ncbi:hypothetical protein RND71_020330 [Anisodus tanguticus]|uniref:Uncharacterized protein n=1 Tax=Anisodus tanguticus TaxID=243964 RepID=A0AAE1S0R1_9SOLA|nr:hypothetical protein RND71_020330 [Anisodus tanguticus]
MGRSAWNELVLQSQQGNSDGIYSKDSQCSQPNVHGREGYTLAIQPNGKTIHENIDFEQSYLNGMSIRGQVYKDTKIDLVHFTKPFMKKLDNPFTLDNVEEDRD